MHGYPEFVTMWKTAKYTCRVQVDVDGEKCMLLPLGRKLVYFLTMQHIWDYLEVAVVKPQH
jgi:hypothetical protein